MTNSTTTVANGSTITPADQRIRSTVYLQLVFIILFWSSNWLVMKTALLNASPFQFNFLRFWGSALVMAALAFPLRVPLAPLAGERLPLAIVGILQIAGMLAFSTIGLQYVGPGRAAVLVYTMQLWALPIGWLMTRERIRAMAWLGGAIGFAGLILFVNPRLINWHDPRVLMGNGLILCGAVCWALGSCFYRRYRFKSAFWTQTFWQVLWSAIVITPVPMLVAQHRPLLFTSHLILALVFNWFCPTALAYFLWSKVLTVMPTSRAGQIVCLVPVLTFVESAIIFHERITSGVALGIFVIFLGMYLTVRSR